MMTFNETRAMFPHFYEAIKRGHLNTTHPRHGGHGLDHDVTVAMIAMSIAPDNHTGLMVWCAGMLHSVDRTVESELVSETMQKFSSLLPETLFTRAEVLEIMDAAFRHSELNQDDQGVVQIILMDADRLANLQSAVIVRAGQFLPHIPAFEFEYLMGACNPETTYHKPKSVLDNLRNNIAEYIPKLRNEKAKILGARYRDELQEFITRLEKNYQDLGLIGVDL